jgi:hypothetical protein
LGGRAIWIDRIVGLAELSRGRFRESGTEVVMALASRMLSVLLLAGAAIYGAELDLAVDQAGQPPARFGAEWLGQDGNDLVSVGPSVGPDGLQDVHIHLSGMAVGVAVKAIRIEGPAGARWEQGRNPKLLSNAELIRDPKDASKGELYFQPDRDLSNHRLKVMVAYDNDNLDVTVLIAGACNAALSMPASPLPELIEGDVRAVWLGQDGASPGARGDVHVALSGLPASLPIVGAVLTDAVRGTWIYKVNGAVSIPDEPTALPLLFKPPSDGKSTDVFFAPCRDETATTMTLRLIASDGRGLLVRFAGANCELGRRARAPKPSRIEARPGDDLQALVAQYGTVVLTPGTYRLRRPLVLSRPVTLTSAGGAILLFDQGATEPQWTMAIELHAGNTTLNGFAVRFAGPVRWNNEVAWGPAVIGMADGRPDEPIVNIAFTHLDLEIPPPENASAWADAVRLLKLIGARNGVIAANILRGGTVEFFGGPCRIVDNNFRGTVPGTISHAVFSGHETHDLLLRDNRAYSVPPSGKTWRFLGLTTFGSNDVIADNNVAGLGALTGDSIPWSNEPEVMLTEAYHVKYEGRVLNLSTDGRIVRTGPPQGGAVRTGDVVSLLRGPAAGQWRRIVQAVDSTTYLVDRSIPKGTDVVSISAGFVNEVFEKNRIDNRGGRRSTGFVFVGNHFGTRFADNHILGGDRAFKLTACPTETPVFWGWTHAPFLGAVIRGNILEDCELGSVLGVEHDARSVKSNEGRTYMSANVEDNVVRWSSSFLRRMEAQRLQDSQFGGLTIGYTASHDPGELVVRADTNRLESPQGGALVPSLVIEAADYNGQRIVNRRFRLPSARAVAPDAGRAAR